MKSNLFRVGVGLFLSLIIAFFTNQYLQSLRNEVQVVTAAKDIAAQTQITADMLSVVKVHAESREALAPNSFSNPSDLVGAVAVDNFKAGEVIVNNVKRLISNEQKDVDGNPVSISDMGRSFFIPADKKALTLSLDAQGSNGFRLKKGDKVDVVFTSTSSDTGGAYSATILQNIEIFEVEAIGGEDKGSKTSSQNITLLVNAQEAQDLVFAKRKGQIDLLLASSRVGQAGARPASPSTPQKFKP